MAMRVRHDRYPYETAIATEHLFPASQLLSEITGVPVQPNKAIIGRNAFAHEAGIHQDGVLKNPLTYEIMTPQSVGVPDSKLVLGKHSGRHALAIRCEQLGYQFDRRALDDIYRRFVRLADKIKHVEDHHLLELIRDTHKPAASATPRSHPNGATTSHVSRTRERKGGGDAACRAPQIFSRRRAVAPRLSRTANPAQHRQHRASLRGDGLCLALGRAARFLDRGSRAQTSRTRLLGRRRARRARVAGRVSGGLRGTALVLFDPRRAQLQRSAVRAGRRARLRKGNSRFTAGLARRASRSRAARPDARRHGAQFEPFDRRRNRYVRSAVATRFPWATLTSVRSRGKKMPENPASTSSPTIACSAACTPK